MTKFSEEICKKLCDLHRKGLPLKACAKKCRVSRESVHGWLKQGREAKSGKKREFFLNWEEADVEYEIVQRKKIEDSKDWKAHQYLLQVNDSETYVVEQKQKVSQDVTIVNDDFKDLNIYDEHKELF